MNVGRSLALAGLFLGTLAFTKTGSVRAEVVALDFDHFYPYYVEYCSATQVESETTIGGIYGHSVLFLKGACRDRSAPYPRIKACENGPGVGLSTDQQFKNVNWSAVEGRDLFFFGGVSGFGTLDESAREATVRRALREGIFKGVEFHDYWLKERKTSESLDHYVANHALDTDYALNFGRTIYCERIPITRGMVEPIVDYYNGLNDYYYLGHHLHSWSDTGDNCAHTIHNALAAVGAWPRKLVNQSFPGWITNLAIPANEFIGAVQASSDGEMPSPSDVASDSYMTHTLMSYGWLMKQGGATIEVIPVHAYRNKIWYTNKGIAFLDWVPGFHGNENEFEQAGRDPRYTDLATNFRWFLEKDELALANASPSIDPRSDSEVGQRYRAYLERQIADLKAKLGEFGP